MIQKVIVKATPKSILEKSEALLTGHFLYTSGKHGGEYMQCAKVLQNPSDTAELAKVIVAGFKGEKIDIVLAPAMGGIIIGYEVARTLDVTSMFAERENGVMTLRRGFAIPKGAKVLVVEDVITTGNSALEVVKIVQEQGGDVVGVGCIVDRTGGEVNLGVKLVAAYSNKMVAYEPEDCPLCKDGLDLVKPGSRVIK